MVSLLGIQLIGAGTKAALFVSIVGAIFVLPFIIFSPLAGYCADRFPKRNVIVSMKAAELMIMVLGLWAFIGKDLTFICVVLFLMAIQSAFYSPAQYGLLPELVEESRLSRGNGYLQMATFTAIIIGTACGSRLKEMLGPQIWKASLLFMGLSLTGLALAWLIGKSKAAQPKAVFNFNGFKQTTQILREIKKDEPLFLTLCGIAYFWFLGAVFQMNILLYAKSILHASDSSVGVLLAAVALGIAFGGVLAGRWSDDQIEFGLVPMGAIGLTAFCAILGVFPLSLLYAGAVLFLLGLSAGFYTVPLNAFFQEKSPQERRGEYLASMNIVNACATLAGSLFVWITGVKLAANPAQIFFILSLVSIAATLYILKTLPIAFVRLVNWLATHTIYRLKVEGADNVPKEGGALLICNHVSYVDALVVSASSKRPIRFIMYRQIYNIPIIHQICKIMKVIPIDFQDGPKGIMRSLEETRKAIESGDLVCIFPEGGLTRTGNMQGFNRGFEKIMKGINAPVIPMYMDNIWGSIFSFHEGRYFWKLPKNSIYPLTVIFGKALPADVKAHEVRIVVQELGAEACNLRGLYRAKLHMAFIDSVKNQPFKFCMADSSGAKFTYLTALAAVLIMKEKLFPKTRRLRESTEMVGVLLPACCAGFIVNAAILMAGKVTVNLNFTLSQETIDSCLKQCRMSMIVTSREFIKKLGIQEMPQMVFLEDIKETISLKNKVSALIWSLMPPKLIKLFCVEGDKVNVDDTATVIFSSGSTGEPKGVMLTHANIFSNIEGFYQIFNVKRNDIVIGALPFFHSFGFTAALCFPVGAGIGVVYHPNPLDAATIGKLAQKYRATILLGTPTFFGAYLRKCTQEQFKTLRIAVVGAEKLKKPLADAFNEKYGIMPFEGYGATELSPIVSVGYPDYVSDDKSVVQTGHKAGTVGHPIPGVAAKVVDPDTFNLLPYDTEGLLMIKGPNVMKGYLNNPQKTDEVIKGGWYITGDIASIDADGFVKITDRLSRFSKIGGEMVPHVKVEEKILEVMGTAELLCAVTAVKDEQKGERLVVLYVGDLDVDWVIKAIGEKGLPNLWIPKRNNFYRVEAIPVLGTGKVDLKAVKAIAQELSQKGTEEV